MGKRMEEGVSLLTVFSLEFGIPIIRCPVLLRFMYFPAIRRMRRANELFFLFAAILACFYLVYWLRLGSLEFRSVKTCLGKACISNSYLDHQKASISQTMHNPSLLLRNENDNNEEPGLKMQNREKELFLTNKQLYEQDVKRQQKDSLPELYVEERYIPVEEIRHNATLLRIDYYDKLPYEYVKYRKDDPICSRSRTSIPQTTDIIRKRQFSKIDFP